MWGTKGGRAEAVWVLSTGRDTAAARQEAGARPSPSARRLAVIGWGVGEATGHMSLDTEPPHQG